MDLKEVVALKRWKEKKQRVVAAGFESRQLLSPGEVFVVVEMGVEWMWFDRQDRDEVEDGDNDGGGGDEDMDQNGQQQLMMMMTALCRKRRIEMKRRSMDYYRLRWL